MLPGFNTVKRDGVTVAGSGYGRRGRGPARRRARGDVTVTGEAPVVDTSRLRSSACSTPRWWTRCRARRNYFGLARMIPGTLGGGNDVGGSLIQDVGQSVIAHGSKNVDQRVTVNGVNTMTLQAGGNIAARRPTSARLRK
jgi:hypothetical protein